MDIWRVLMQALAPPFPQMLLLPAAMLAVTYALIRLSGIRNPKIRSVFYSLPLFIPLVVYLFYHPSLWVTRPVHYAIINTIGAPLGVVNVSSFGTRVVDEVVGINITGLLCIIGLAFGGAVLLISYAFGTGIVRRFQGVVEVTSEDEPWIHSIVEKAAKRVGVPKPRIGLTESLQPNAFTVGYGRNAIVVFSSGIISTLSGSELEAVASHELAHIRNGDFHLLAVSSALRVVSFFNPIAYLSSSMLVREREFLADEVGSKSIHRGATLRRALIKIASAQLDVGFHLPDLISSLFIYSNIGSIRAAFTSHPSLDTRVRRIGCSPPAVVGERYRAVGVALLLIGAFALSFNLLQPFRLDGEVWRLCSTFGILPLGPHGGLGSITRTVFAGGMPPSVPGMEKITVLVLPG